jgi:signal transduction histidine kinase
MAHLWEVTISKKAKMVFNLAAELPPVEADATQMRQVVMNLITNAAEAIGDRAGTVTVTTSTAWCTPSELADASFGERLKEGDYVVLEVADTGCGMDVDTQSRMFEPFFTTTFTGRGLGLSGSGHRPRPQEAIRSQRAGPGTHIRVLFPARADLGGGSSRHDVDRRWGAVLVVDEG